MTAVLLEHEGELLPDELGAERIASALGWERSVEELLRAYERVLIA